MTTVPEATKQSPDAGPFARAFKVTFPDGFSVDGVQFPSGRCVLDDARAGLIQAAVSLEELPMIRDYELATVVWADRQGGVS